MILLQNKSVVKITFSTSVKRKLSCADLNTVVLEKVPEFFSHKLYVYFPSKVLVYAILKVNEFKHS